MTNLRLLVILNTLVFLGLFESINGQMDPCVDYPPIDGPTCYVCAPEGWDNFDTPAEVFDLDNLCCSPLCTYNIQDLSPTGGTFMHIQTATSPEMMGTTLTGLSPGAEYLITFYWMSLYCDPLSTTGPDLIITLDGEEYYYEAVYDWELIEICFTPSDTQVDLILNPETIPSGGALVVDTGDCLEATLECCALQIEIEDTWSICPDQVLNIFGEAQNVAGTLNISWSSNPPEGVNYLSDLTIIDPEFFYPLGEQNFEGTNFTYTITIEDDLCIVERDIYVEVFPTTEPDFDLPDVCEDDGSYAFPLISENGITGTWLIEDIEPEDLSGMTVMNTFFPDEDPFLCPIEVQDALFIDPLQFPMFELPDQICHSDGPVYVLPEQDINNIEGVWNIEEILLEEYQNESVNLIFTPYDTYCTETYETELLVLIDSLSFNLPDTICQDAGLILLDSISNEGYLGNWVTNPIDPSLYQDSTIRIKWYVSAGQNPCVDSFEQQIYISGSVDPVFSLPTVLCVQDDVVLLPLTSDNGVNGMWDIAQIDPASLGQGSHSVQFISDSLNCFVEYVYELEIVDASVPVFILPDSLCALDDEFVLAENSENGITGQWNLQSFLPADYEGQTIDLNFQPDINCAQPVSHSIFVQVGIMPEFSLPDFLCWDDSELLLPMESNNSVLGSWNVQSIIPSQDAGMTMNLVFSPDQDYCSFEYTHAIEVINYETIDLNSINPSDCNSSDGQIIVDTTNPALEFSINGGVDWQVSLVFENLSSGFYEILQRESAYPDCIFSSNVILESPDAPEITNIDVQSITSCLVDNGSIEVIATGNNLEYSIDGGVTWQSNTMFSNLPADLYTLSIREIGSPDCTSSEQFEIEGIDAPVINDLLIQPLSDCNEEDASIEILTDNLDVVFALNNTSLSQSGNMFENLGPGEYTAYLIDPLYPDCIDSTDFVIEPLMRPEVNSFIIEDELDCEANNGNAFIEAVGSQLEYSIDNGLTWQNDPEFTMLPPGDYIVLIREQDYPSCFTEINFTVLEADCPCTSIELDFSIEDIVCNYVENGLININEVIGIANQDSYEVIWSTGAQSNLISDLSAGWYYCTISYDIDCTHIDSFQVNTLPPISFDLQTYDSDCETSNNGSVEVVNVQGGSGVYFYGIEDSDVQSESGFYNLSPGMYTMLVQDEFDCAYYDSFNIDYGQAPSWQLPFDLEIEVGDSLYLNPLIDITTIDSFEWLPSAYILNPGVLEALVTPDSNTEFCLTIYYGECQDVKCISVSVLEAETTGIYLANTFNPNSIGTNRYFYPQSSSNNNAVIDAFRIYDRWGNLVFINEDFQINVEQSGWNGLVGNQNAAQGVYVYLMEYSLNGKTEIISGTITLVY